MYMYMVCECVFVTDLPTSVYSGASDNGLPLLRKPPQCRQKATVPNISYNLLYIVTSV